MAQAAAFKGEAPARILGEKVNKKKKLRECVIKRLTLSKVRTKNRSDLCFYRRGSLSPWNVMPDRNVFVCLEALSLLDSNNVI